MKVRIKFSKQGQMKFIGHLDMMRYFQKAIRRANIDISYSEGFSPHQKMSFASPLSVGLLSMGEYFDIEVNSLIPSQKAVSELNKTMVEGVEVLSYRLLPQDAKNCMASIAAADYFVHIIDECPWINKKSIDEFMKQDRIDVLKKTKKSEKIIDIRPLIIDISFKNDGIFMKLAAGSSENLKPEPVLEALASYLNMDVPRAVYERLEMYAEIDGSYVALEDIGENID